MRSQQPGAPPRRPTDTRPPVMGLVVVPNGDEDLGASGILGGVVANGPGYMWTNDVCSRSQTCVIGPSSCSSADGGDGRSAIHVVEALRTKSRQGTGYWMRTMTETGPRAQLLFHDDCSYSIHAVNSKWFLIGDQCKTGFEVFRLWDRITGRRRIRDTEPSRFIFNKSNEDEAVVLASGPIFVVIDVAQSFSEGTAKVLSETKWKKPSDDGRSPRSFIVLVESNADFSSKLFTVEETTGNFKKLSNRVLECTRGSGPHTHTATDAVGWAAATAPRTSAGCGIVL
ncbi:hypothetical protein Pelo_2392 [Pelomyxa schiedti]|nr:hypothetical protein Pelo_2392 [Pelomyxa schiedti]